MWCADHRDLKAENVLQLADGVWVLCDFGSATTRAKVYQSTQDIAVEEEVIRKHTTPAYRAPEVCLSWQLHVATGSIQLLHLVLTLTVVGADVGSVIAPAH